MDEKVGEEIAAPGRRQDVCPGSGAAITSFENLNTERVIVQGWPAWAYMLGRLNMLAGRTLVREVPRQAGDHARARTWPRTPKLKVGDDGLHVRRPSTTSSASSRALQRLENTWPHAAGGRPEVLGKRGQITGCTVRLKDTSAEGRKVRQADRGRRGRRSCGLKGKIQAEVARPVRRRSNTQIRRGKAMAWMTSAVALFIGGIGMLNTMIMSVFERTREIGILRAIGWRPRRVMRMILMESVLLSLGGGVAGHAGGHRPDLVLSRLPAVNGAIQAASRPRSSSRLR